jgi:glycogen synthase
MKIFIYSRHFAPSVGGMEKLLEILAGEFVGSGHQVTVATETLGDGEFRYPVHRAPGFGEFVRLARACDVILTAPISLRRLPAMMLARRRIAVAHPDLHGGPAARLKDLAARFVANIVPSHYMAGHFPHPIVIENPFDARNFRWPDDGKRDGIVFIGRLVEHKGCHVLIRALAQIAGSYPDARLTVAGEGEQRGELETLVQDLGLADRITFAGPVIGAALGELVRSSRIMVVPTIGQEPFGIVALEGLASGCRMVVARSGGLPEAVGDQAILFERGNVEACAAALRQALDETGPPDREAVERHLAQFRPDLIAGRYLEVLLGLASGPGRAALPAEPAASPR